MLKPTTPSVPLFATLLASQAPKRTRGGMIALSVSLIAHALVVVGMLLLTHGSKARVVGAEPAFTLMLADNEIKPLRHVDEVRTAAQPTPRPRRRSVAARTAAPAPPAADAPSPPDIAQLEPKLDTRLATSGLTALAADLSRAGEALADQLVGDSVGDSEPSLEELEAGGPVFTPYSVGPLLLNRGEIADILRERYPLKMREKRLGGLTTLWLLVDKDGNARKAVLHESSGYEVFDSLAIDVVPTMRFSPALNNGSPKPVWIQLPVRFRVVDGYDSF